MGIRPPAMRRQRERGRSDRAFVILNGRRVKLGVWGSEAAERKYLELIAGSGLPLGNSPKEPEPLPSRPMVMELAPDFLENVLRDYASNEREIGHYRVMLRLLIGHFGEVAAEDFGPRRLRALQQAMVDKGWARTTCNDQLRRVVKLFRWAVADERIPGSVYQNLKAVEPLRYGRTAAPEPKEVPPVPLDVVKATLPHCQPITRVMIKVQLATGMRPGEVVQLATEHIDRTGDAWLFRVPKHKCQRHGKDRVVAIGETAQELLKPYLFTDGPFFPVKVASYRQAIRRACRRAFRPPTDLPKRKHEEWHRQHLWKPNQLRHTAATEGRAACGVEATSCFTGHSRVAMTEHYARKNQTLASEVARKVEQAALEVLHA